MSNLVIVESPSKAKTLKNYLGSGFNVVASVGHVRDLPPAKLSVDVKNDFAPKYAIVKGKEKLVKELQQAVAESDKVFLATDPDREGEAISWHLATLLDLDLNESNRVTFNEITKTGVKNGMAAPRKVDLDLVNAQQARRILDRLVGYKLSPFVSQKIRRGLSAGRVQSVALRIICDREQEIRDFVSKEYWTIEGKFAFGHKIINAQFFGDETGKIDIENEEQADALLARMQDAKFLVSSLKKGQKKINPLPPFITSTLQQDAAKRLGYRPERTMQIAQQLYEGIELGSQGSVGLITYMRTDSLRVSAEAQSAALEYIRSNFGASYAPSKPNFYKSRSNAQDGHEAIRPSDIFKTPEQIKPFLSNEQFRLYELIWKRFLASQMIAGIQSTAKLEIKGVREDDLNRFVLFRANGHSMKFDGCTRIYDAGEGKDELLPLELKADDPLKVRDIAKSQHFTQPPARYSEQSLIKTLEENGVGRPSTYATIISTIVKREYVERKNKQLIPTELGEAISKLLKEKFPKIVNTKFTAQMESDLDLVGEGKEDYIALLHTFYDDFELNLNKVKGEMEGVKIHLQEDQTDIPCDKCGRMMVVKVGRFGKFLACPGYPDCKNTKPYVIETKATCPKCGSRVIQKKSKKGHTFFGCENWPNCDFMTWDTPTDKTCPNCGSYLFKGRGGVTSCLKEGCGYQVKTRGRKKKD